MRRFHLHVINNGERWPDEAGQLLPHLDEARAEAVRGVRSLIAEEAKQGKIDLRGCIEITDENGELLDRLTFGEVFELHLDGPS